MTFQYVFFFFLVLPTVSWWLLLGGAVGKQQKKKKKKKKSSYDTVSVHMVLGSSGFWSRSGDDGLQQLDCGKFWKHDERDLESVVFKSLPVEGFQNFSDATCVIIVVYSISSSCMPFRPFLSYMSVSFAKDAKLRRSTQAEAEHKY